jgi:hypothetical protein
MRSPEHVFSWGEEKEEPAKQFDIMSIIRQRLSLSHNLIDESRYSHTNPHYIILKKRIDI